MLLRLSRIPGSSQKLNLLYTVETEDGRLVDIKDTSFEVGKHGGTTDHKSAATGEAVVVLIIHQSVYHRGSHQWWLWCSYCIPATAFIAVDDEWILPSLEQGVNDATTANSCVCYVYIYRNYRRQTDKTDT